MARAQGSQVEIAYKVETTPGTTPGTGTWQAIRKNSESMSGTSDVVESGEIRSDRESASDVQGNKNVGGNIVSELSADSHDILYESAFFSAFGSAKDTGATTLDAVNATNKFTRSTGSFVTDGFSVGQWVLSSGFSTAANNGWFLITALDATNMTVAGGTLADESGGGDEQITSKIMTGGTTAKYLSISKRYRDINKEIVFGGNIVDSVAITLAPNQVVGVTFVLNGLNEADPTAAGALADDVSTSDPFDSFSGQVLIDGVVNNNVTAFDITLANNIADGFVIGSRFKTAQFAGRRSSSGNISFYFEDLSEYSDSVDHTSKSVAFSFTDGTNYYGLTFPRSYYDLPTPPAENEGPLLLTGPFRAKLDSTTSASIIMSRSA
jgi:hypothetical protein